MSHALLFLNGSPPNLDNFNFEKLSKYKIIVCADGAYNYLRKSKINPNVVIGDFDSIKNIDRKNQKIEFIKITDQNSTDFEKALDYLCDINIYHVEVWGVGWQNKNFELDHILGNLATALKYKSKLKLIFNTDNQTFYFLDKKTKIETKQNQIISLYPFPLAKSITTKGLLYPLTNENLDIKKRLGIRNRTVGKSVEINFSRGEILVIITK